MKPARFPFKTLAALGILSFAYVESPPLRLRYAHTKEMVKKAEFYPLSSFPMYSTFSDQPFTVYVTAAGEPVAIEHAFKTHASELKKTYELELKELRKGRGGRLLDLPPEIREQAGVHTLQLLSGRPESREWLAAAGHPALQLHEVILTFDDDGIARRDTMVAELRVPVP